MRIRTATADDADAICAIHNQGIEDRVATLDTTIRSPDGVRTWLAERGPRHPVYVERLSRGQGIGRRLLDRLIELARAAGYHKMVLAALATNDAGVGLYTSAGFTRVGIYHEQGLLDGTWVDVVIMEKLL
jgi:L-amino acid N-acyltransferase YncA